MFLPVDWHIWQHCYQYLVLYFLVIQIIKAWYDKQKEQQQQLPNTIIIQQKVSLEHNHLRFAMGLQCFQYPVPVPLMIDTAPVPGFIQQWGDIHTLCQKSMEDSWICSLLMICLPCAEEEHGELLLLVKYIVPGTISHPGMWQSSHQTFCTMHGMVPGTWYHTSYDLPSSCYELLWKGTW